MAIQLVQIYIYDGTICRFSITVFVVIWVSIIYGYTYMVLVYRFVL